MLGVVTTGSGAVANSVPYAAAGSATGTSGDEVRAVEAAPNGHGVLIRVVTILELAHRGSFRSRAVTS